MFVGELNKVVGVSATRFRRVLCQGGAGTVVVGHCVVVGTGVSGELLRLGMYSSSPVWSNAGPGEKGGSLLRFNIVVNDSGHFCHNLTADGRCVQC